MDRIRVGVITSAGKAEIRLAPMPRICPGRVLVRIEACGICTSEQRIYSGAQHWDRFPYVGGHEAVGIVEEIGPDTGTDVAVGDRVALFSATCGNCHNCRRGRSSKCEHRDAFWEHGDLWGTWGFSDYRLVRPRGLLPLAPDVPLEYAALAEPLSCAVHGLNRSQVQLGDEVVVVGAGAMGLLNALVFTARGAVVTVLDLVESRCQRALEAGVARAFIPDDSTVKRIHTMTGGRGPEVVVVASSSPKAYELARTLLGPLGQLLAFAAVYPAAEDLFDWTQVHRSEQVLFGAVSSDIDDIRIAGKVISSRMLDLSPVVESVVPFETFSEAMKRSVKPDTYRIVLRM